MMKKSYYSMLCLLIVLTLTYLTGCSTAQNTTSQKENTSISIETQKSGSKIYNGKNKIKSSNGIVWTPPSGSRNRSDGKILDENGVVIGDDGSQSYHYSGRGLG